MALKKERDFTVALIGKNGIGKSSSGNTILGRNVFKIGDWDVSSTFMAKIGFTKRSMLNLIVIDTPGFMNLEDGENVDNIAVQISEMMSVCLEGINAFCLVFKYGAEYTDEDRRGVEKIEEIFGETFLEKHGLIIMTGGDVFNFNRDKGIEQADSFEKWCDIQTGELRNLIDKCNKRIVLFNNEGGLDEREVAVDQLISNFYKIKINSPYISEKFAICFTERENALKENSLPQLSWYLQGRLDRIMTYMSRLKTIPDSEVKSLNDNILELTNVFIYAKHNVKTHTKLIEKTQEMVKTLDRKSSANQSREKLTKTFRLLGEIRNPPISTSILAKLLAEGVGNAGVLSGGVLDLGVVASKESDGMVTNEGKGSVVESLEDKIKRMIEIKLNQM